MSQQLKSVGAVSCAKVSAVVYGILGLLLGIVFSVVFTVAGFAGNSSEVSNRMGPLGFLLGASSIIFFPILYAMIGAIGGLIAAALYNVVAKYTGGIEIEIG